MRKMKYNFFDSVFVGLIVLMNLTAYAGISNYSTRMMTNEEFERYKRHKGVYAEKEDLERTINGKKVMRQPPTEDQLERIRYSSVLVENAPLGVSPDSVDWSDDPYFPPVGDQGYYWADAGWATGYYMKTFQEAKEHGWDLSSSYFSKNYIWEVFQDTAIFTPAIKLVNNTDKIFSPDFIYHRINAGWDIFRYWSVEDAMDLLFNTGCCTWQYQPADSTPYTRTDSTSWCNYEAGWREAPLYRSKTNYQIIDLSTSEGLETLKQVIADGHLACIEMDPSYFYHSLSDSDFFSLNNYVSDYYFGVNTIVGYNDNYGPYTELGDPYVYGAFKIVNQDGIGGFWEHVPDGFYFMSYACMQQRIKYAYFYENEEGYNPQLISIFNMYHDSTRGDCKITFGLGDTEFPDIAKRFDDYPFVEYTKPMYYPYQSMVLDITDFVPYMVGGANTFFMKVYDRDWTEGGFPKKEDPVSINIGRIDDFYIEFYDDYLSGIPTETYLSTDPYPVATEDGDSVYAWVIDKDSINVTPVDTTVSWQAGEVSFYIDCISSQPLSWTATIISGGGWLDFVTDNTGVGDGSFGVSFEDNFDVINPRSGIVRLSCPQALNSPIDINITQPNAEYFIATLPETLMVDWLENDTLFNVLVDGPDTLSWTATVTSGTSWLGIIYGSPGTGDDTVLLWVGENSDPTSNRTGTIEITAPAAVNSPFEMAIVQSRAEYAIAADPVEIDTGWESGDSTLQVTIDRSYGLNWTASVTEGGSWLSITSGSSGSGDGQIGIHWDENSDALNGRTGTIQIDCPLAAETPVEVNVNQNRLWEALFLQPETLNVSWSAGDTLFSVLGYSDAPLDWTASVVQGGSWLSIVSGVSGSGDGTVTVEYDANPDPYNSRQGRIRLESSTAVNTPVEAILTQAWGEYLVEIQPSFMPVSWQSGDSTFQVSIAGPGPLNWTAAVINGGSWLSITSGSSGSGDGSINSHWDENINPDIDRSGTIQVVCPDAINDTVNVTVSQSQTVEFFKITSGAIVNDGKLSEGVSWADYDNDGDQDIFVANGNDVNQQKNYLYKNNGNGTFTQIEMDTGPSFGSTWGDYDNDGDLDLFISNYGNNFLYRNEGSGTLIKIETGVVVEDGGYSRGCAWGDYDNDGYLDLFVANYGNQANFLYHNDRNGTFTKITQGEIVTDQNDSRGCSWGDYDSDGDLDLFVANYSNQNNSLYRNNGNDSFTKVVMGDVVNNGGKSVGCSWGDYNNDGNLDLFVTNRQDQNNYLYLNNGDLSFSQVTTGPVVTDGGMSYGSAWADYDNDGDLDLFVANELDQNNFLYRNNGDATFIQVLDAVPVTDGGISYGAAWGDYDNDGNIDLFVTNYGENNALYINNQFEYHWINIKCTGTVSNPSGIGARVKIKATISGQPVWQTREISAQTGYLSQNSLNEGFGLGDAVLIDSIHIRWSSGIEWDTTNVAIDQFLTLYEWANPPSAVNDYSATTEEISVQISPLSNDSDPDSDPMIIESALTSETHGTVLIDSGDTTLTYTPDIGFTGTDRFQYVIRDSHCGRDTAQVSVQVNPKPNTRPAAVNDATSTITGYAVTVFVLSNDSDTDEDSLHVQSLITTDTEGSAAIDAGDTTVTYTPDDGYIGTDAFQYIVSDGNGGLDTASVTVQVTLPPNQRPVAVSDAATTMQRVSVLINPLTNDSDPDTDPITISAIITTGTNGAVIINSGNTTVTYTPQAAFSGDDIFSYVISDGKGGLDTASVTVHVIPNARPAAGKDSLTTWEGVTVEIDVLANDTDSDGDDLSITGLDTLTTAGNVIINSGDTTVIYTAPVGYSGFDSFRYFVSDGRGGADTATVKIDVRMLSAVYMGGGIPVTYDLSNNFPNPFNPETEFRYQLPKMCDVYAVVYSMLGQQEIRLINERQPAGYFKLRWDGRNSRGQQVPSGIYILRMQAGSYSAIRKMMLLR